jgi:uncharacterized membrane protein
MTRLLARALTVAAVLWTAAILFVPLVLPLRVHAYQASGAVAAGVYTAAGLICHQRPERSFHVNATQVPVCARCMGLYLSGALAALAAWLGAPRVPRGMRACLIAAAVPTAVTLGVEWAGVADPGNAVRFIAALPLGAYAGWLFVRMLRAESAPTTCAMIS